MSVNKSVNFTFLFRQSFLIILFCFLLLFDTANRDLTWTAVNGISLLLFSGLLLFWIICGSKLDPKFLILLVGLFILGIAAWLTSDDVYRSLISLGLLMIPLVLGIFSAEMSIKGWHPDLFINAILIVGGMMMVFTWLGVTQWYGSWLSASGGQFFPNVAYRLSAPNVQAWNLNPLIMLAGLRLLTSRKKFVSFGWFVYLLSALALMFLTSSRGGWLATAAGFTVLGLFIFRNLNDAIQRFWKRIIKQKIIMAAFILLSAMIVAGGGWFLYSQATHPSHGSILDARLEYWPAAWETFIANPFFGQGMGTFSSVLLREHSTPPFGIYLHAHSLPLTVLAENGLIGFVLLLFFVGLSGWIFRKMWQQHSAREEVLFWGLLAMWVAAFTHSILDCMVGKTSGTWIIVILFGLVLSKAGKVEKKNYWAVIPSIFCVCFLSLVFLSSSNLQNAQRANSQGEIEKARMYFQFSEGYQQLNATFQSQYGLILASANGEAGNIELLEAIEHLRSAVRLDPDWSLGHLNLAALLASNGNFDEATEEINKAARLSPNCAMVQLNRGWLAEQMGDESITWDAYQNVLTLEPEWREASYWRENSVRREIRERWLMENPESESLSLDELAAEISTNPDRARLYLESARLHLLQGNIPASERMIDISRLVYLRTALDEIEADWMEAEIAALQGNIMQAIFRAELALNRYLHQGLAGPGTNQGQLYANLVFRTISGEDELVPQVTTIALPDRWVNRVELLAQWLTNTGDTQSAEEWLEICENLAFDQCR